MYKRLAAGLLAVASTLAIVGATPAVAADSAQPCAVYPPGQTYYITAIPNRAVINRGTNIKLVAVVARGPRRTPCNGYLTILRYGFAPNTNAQWKRTDARGVAVFIAINIRANRTYFFRVYAGVVRRSANVGLIIVV